MNDHLPPSSDTLSPRQSRCVMTVLEELRDLENQGRDFEISVEQVRRAIFDVHNLFYRSDCDLAEPLRGRLGEHWVRILVAFQGMKRPIDVDVRFKAANLLAWTGHDVNGYPRNLKVNRMLAGIQSGSMGRIRNMIREGAMRKLADQQNRIAVGVET